MKKEVFKQFLKFAIVGVINTLINLIVLYFLTEFFGVYYMISAVFAFIVAVTNSFILNKIWTFKERMWDKTGSKYTKFFVVSVAALLVNLALLYSLTEFLHLHYMFSQIIAIAISLWVNFLGNRAWTFKIKNLKNE